MKLFTVKSISNRGGGMALVKATDVSEVIELMTKEYVANWDCDDDYKSFDINRFEIKEVPLVEVHSIMPQVIEQSFHFED